MRYFYECIARGICPWVDVGYKGPDQRRDRWPRKGRNRVQPTHVLHVIRCHSNILQKTGEQIKPPDYIVTNKPLAKRYTDTVTYGVSRMDDPAHGKKNRVIRNKTSEPKFRLLSADEITDFVRANAYDYGDDWDAHMFEEPPEVLGVQ